ncbi:DUF2339 domain-containing protein [Campylobacter sp. MIT 21-1685]|uniref:DUF2339 domain-containing protein n=1 Tax=unclassified Campylobacter TaxID=2593542 RepID=UPI00224A92F5|nr:MULTISPECIES: DUF2339 domain-containing protein [unclassified Campylobacter]MCX2682953.1 DUF2339 domain-containing protein [Campylobacter sp. MIT 21-1684]MCX2751235.1 DUF2339 domain-containing protein [Campylobacter sp. MIT 21-1682]MCX2807434.1 DUF2339 domain-containing protein [Campylobacter sp. MIT 21-1685]
MELFILLFILLSILVVCGSIAGLIAYFSTKRLQEHLNTLDTQIIALKFALNKDKQSEVLQKKNQISENGESAPIPQVFSQSSIHLSNPTTKPSHTQENSKSALGEDSNPKATSKTMQSTQSQALKQKDFFDFEWLFTQKVMVFLAGIFFIFAASFLIRYSLEHNLLTPVVHISLCIGFGGILFVSGISLHFAHHRSIFYRIYNLCTLYFKRIAKIQPSIPLNTSTLNSSTTKTLQTIAQTLVGSALVVLFFSFYGGFKVYGFFGDFFTLVVLSLIALVGLVLSVRLGIVIGIFGLLGGFATPLLLSSGAYNAIFVFSYLGMFYAISLYCALRYASSQVQILYLITLANALMFLYMCHFLMFFAFINSAPLIFFILCGGMFISNIILLAKFSLPKDSYLFLVFVGFSALCPLLFIFFLINREDMGVALNWLEYAFLAALCILSLLVPCIRSLQKQLSLFALHLPLIASFAFVVLLFCLMREHTPFVIFSIMFFGAISAYLLLSKAKIMYLWLQFMAVCGFSIMMYANGKDTLYVYCVWFAMGIFAYSYVCKYISAQWTKAKNLDYLLLLYSILCAIGAVHLSGMPFVIWVFSGLIFAYLGGQILKRNIAYFEYIFITLGILANIFSSEGLLFIEWLRIPLTEYSPHIFNTLLALLGVIGTYYNLNILLLSLGSCSVLLFILRHKTYAFHTLVNITLLSICCISVILMIQKLTSINLFRGNHHIPYPLSTLCIGFLALIMGKYVYVINTLSTKVQSAYVFVLSFLGVKFYYDVIIFGIFAYNPLMMFLPHWNLYDITLFLVGLIACLLVAWYFQSILRYFQNSTYYRLKIIFYANLYLGL